MPAHVSVDRPVHTEIYTHTYTHRHTSSHMPTHRLSAWMCLRSAYAHVESHVYKCVHAWTMAVGRTTSTAAIRLLSRLTCHLDQHCLRAVDLQRLRRGHVCSPPCVRMRVRGHVCRHVCGCVDVQACAHTSTRLLLPPVDLRIDMCVQCRYEHALFCGL